MKSKLSFSSFAFLALALGMATLTPTFAQTDSTPPAAPAKAAALTAEERAQLTKAHDAALAADPALKTEDDSLTKQRADLKAKGASASADDKAALKAKWTEHQDKLHAAMIKIDPTVAPLIDKMKAAHHKST